MCDIDRSKTTKGRHMGHVGRELIAGAKAPAFTLSRDGGGTVSLRDFKGGKLVLYFYPKADTPGCTKEAMEFSACALILPRRAPPFSVFQQIRLQRRTNSKPSIACPSP